MPRKKTTPQGYSHVLLAREIWREYEDKRPSPGEYDNWVRETAAKFEVDESLIRQQLATQARAFRANKKSVEATVAQQVAELVGATQEKALLTLAAGLEAGIAKPLLDKSGKPILDEDTGKPMVFEVPDWVARIAAVKEINKIYGAYAPSQVEIKEEKHVFHHLSEAELMQRAHELAIDISRLATEGSRTGEITGRTDLPEAGKGRALLADPSHKDEGRTRPS